MHTHITASILAIVGVFALIGLVASTTYTITGQAGVRYRWGNMLHTCNEDRECGPAAFCQKLMGDDLIGQCTGKYNEGTACLQDTQCRSLCCQETCTNTENCYPKFRDTINDLHEKVGNDKKLVFHNSDSFKSSSNNKEVT